MPGKSLVGQKNDSVGFFPGKNFFGNFFSFEQMFEKVSLT